MFAYFIEAQWSLGVNRPRDDRAGAYGGHQVKTRTATFATALVIAVTSVAAPIASAQDVRTGTAGGGNCSVWAKMKSAVFGVHCDFYMMP